MISFLRCNILELNKMFSDEDEIFSMNPNGDPDSIDVWYRPNGRAKLLNAATDVGHDVGQPQQLKAEIAALANELEDFNSRRVAPYGRITEIVAKMQQLSAV